MKFISIALLIAIMISSIPVVSGSSSGIHIDAYTNKNFYLNNEVITVTYSVYKDNGRPVSGSGRWDLEFWNYTSLNYTVVAEGTFSHSEGSIKINLASYNLSNAGTGRNYYINMEYSTSYAHTSTVLNVQIMDVRYYIFHIYTAPISGTYSPNYYAKLVISSMVPSLPIDYIKVFYEGGTILYLKNAYLNSDGYYYRSFLIPSDAYPGENIYISSSIEGKTETVYFTVEKDYGLYLSSNENLNEVFLSGESVNITVKSKTPIDAPYYRFWIEDENGNTIMKTSGNVSYMSFKIPADYSGLVIIKCSVFNSTQKIGSLRTTISVVYASITLYADRNTYTGGEEITVYTDFKSYVMKNPQFIYNVFADFGNGYTLINTVSTDKKSITIDVPSNPPESYRIGVYAIDGSMHASSYIVIEYENLVTMDAYVITKSDYSTKVYTPGQTIEIKYTLNDEVDDAILKYGFDEQFYREPQIIYLGHVKGGVITLEIPENTKTGIHAIHIHLSYKGGEITKDVYIQVDENPPWGLYVVWGMPLIDFLILLIVIAITVFAVIYLKYGKRKEIYGE